MGWGDIKFIVYYSIPASLDLQVRILNLRPTYFWFPKEYEIGKCVQQITQEINFA